MGLLSSLFGGGKAKDKAPAKSAAKHPPAAPEPAKSMKPAAPAEPAATRAATPAGGAEQVKLRLKLAAAQKAGDAESALVAAKALEAIQAKAGRRVAARVWREEAERIMAAM